MGGGIDNRGTLTLNSSTVSGNTVSQKTIADTTAVGVGGGISNSGLYNGVNSTLTLTGSSVMGNSAQAYGGGIISTDNLTLHSSTVSGNTAGTYGGGVASGGLMTVTNSTVSGNSASVRGGGVNSTGTLALTNSTISGNASGSVGGGLFNLHTGAVTLIQSLLSGTRQRFWVRRLTHASGTVIGDSFNLFGHDGFSGVTGFTLGATDLVSSVPVPSILDPTLSNNGGPTRTHGLVSGSPALDAVPGAGCATGIDQRGAPRPQDGDGDTSRDCDIRAVERGLIPIQVEIRQHHARLPDPRLSGLRPVQPLGDGVQESHRHHCNQRSRTSRRWHPGEDPQTVPVRRRCYRSHAHLHADDAVTADAKRDRVVRTTEKRLLTGRLAIRENAATVTNTPATISTTRVTLRLRRR